MKSIFTIFLFAFILSGCANNFTSFSSSTSKQTLISKANSGDINAMITLNKIALFPENKEGLMYYSKWYPLVLISSNPAQILSFAEVFDKYKYMFINGEDKYFKLLEAAADLGDRSALFMLLEEFNYNYQYDVPNRIIPNATNHELLRLLSFYKEKRLKQKVQDIEKILTSRNASLNYKTFYEEIKSLYKKKDNEALTLKLEKAQLLDDQAQLLKIATFLTNRIRLNDAIKIYERLIALDANNPDYYVKLADSYRKSSGYNRSEYKNNPLSDNRLQALKTASLLDHYEATLKLLTIYTQGQALKNGKLLPRASKRKYNTGAYAIDFSAEYYEHVKKVSGMNEAKRGLAQFYYKKKNVVRGATILNELAENGNENAMVMLAKRVKQLHPDDNTLAKKWLSFIMNSNNLGLINKLKTEIRYFTQDDIEPIPELQKAHIKITQLFETDNIPYLKKREKENYAAGDEAQQNAYIKKAAELGDVESLHKLAVIYLNKNDAENINKAISIYKTLGEKEDVAALAKLASIYQNTDVSIQGIQSDDLAISYYTRAADLEHVNSMYELFCLYFCRENLSAEKMKEYQDKIDVYIDKVIAMKKSRHPLIGGVARMYYNLNDFEKSAYYYQKGGEAGSSYSYKKAALIYKNKLNDDEKYLFNLHKSSDAGDGGASLDLYQYYQRKQDDKNALKYLLISVEDENKDAMEFLANNYVTGRLVEKDMHKAVVLYKKAVSRNPSKIGLLLGLIYHYGEGGIEIDLKEAKKWYAKSRMKQARENLKIVKEQMKLKD